MKQKSQHTTPQADKYLISVSPQGRIRKEGIDKPPHYTTLNKIVGGHSYTFPPELVAASKKQGQQ